MKKLLANGFGGALLMEPRTGKTKTTIDYASILWTAGKASRVVIFCPVSVMGVWKDEIQTHCPADYTITLWDKRARNRGVKFPPAGRPQLDFVIINYDALSVAARPQRDRKTGAIRRDEYGRIKRSRRKGGRYAAKQAILDWAPHLLVLDESHRIKTPSARKTTIMHSLAAEIDYRVILTGTPVTKKKRVLDIWSQWQVINPSRFPGMTSRDFKERYSVFTERNGYPQWLKNQNQEELLERIHADAFVVTRAECFDLPPRLPPEIIRVELEGATARAYDQMAEVMVAQIHTGEITEASIPLVQGLRLQQITSGLARTEPTPAYPKGRVVRIGQEKLTVLKDRLEDFFEAEEKVVIAARFIADLQSIEELCKKFKVPTFVLKGGLKPQERDAAIKGFRVTEGAAAFVMQPTVGSLGIDLSTAGTFIWYSLISSYVDYTQAEDRIALNPHGTRFIYLLAEGTYDEVMYQTLQEDGDVAKAVMRKPESILRQH